MSIPVPEGREAVEPAAPVLSLADRRARLTAVAVLPLMHLATYWITTRVTELRGPGVLIQTEIPLDRLVPYLPATWPLYWVAYLYAIVGGGMALFRMPEARFRRAVVAVAGMMLIGCAIQLLFPAVAPWPANPTTSQRLFHDSAIILPYATLPSMHVAYCVFTAGVVSATFPGWFLALFGWVVVLAVAISTLTLREHVILDALTGLTLALATLWWWRRDLP